MIYRAMIGYKRHWLTIHYTRSTSLRRIRSGDVSVCLTASLAFDAGTVLCREWAGSPVQKNWQYRYSTTTRTKKIWCVWTLKWQVVVTCNIRKTNTVTT